MIVNELNWLIKIKEFLYANDGRDLYDIIFETLENHKMTFSLLLKLASEGHGYSPIEGNSYSLDQDWDLPEEFDEVSFMFGDYESSTISPRYFVELMQVISDSYMDEHPNDKVSIEQSMARLKRRYV